MIYLLDTAETQAIRHKIEYYPVEGVTTNPTIISHEKRNFGELIREIRGIIGEDRMLHVQTTGQSAESIVKEALALKEYVGGNFYAKIPTTQEGIKAMAHLKNKGVKITATAIFTQQQALICAKAGADFVAPYVNRLDNISSDGAQVVTDIVNLIHNYSLPTRVLAASFKNVEQVHKISLKGVHSVTISPELMDSLLFHPLTDQAVSDFTRDWEGVYGKGTRILEMLD